MPKKRILNFLGELIIVAIGFCVALWQIGGVA